MTAQPETIEFVELIAAAADAKQGEDIVALDVSAPLGIVEAFVLVTGRNERNVQSIADEIEDQALKSGRKALRREGRDLGRWILLDFGDAVAHVFHEEERTFYSLERLWRDCPVIPVNVSGNPVIA
jgi:ribosome-associated protein